VKNSEVVSKGKKKGNEKRGKLVGSKSLIKNNRKNQLWKS
jgi:hypothetical protein